MKIYDLNSLLLQNVRKIINIVLDIVTDKNVTHISRSTNRIFLFNCIYVNNIRLFFSLNARLSRVDKNTKKSAEENEVRDDETEISRLFGSEQMHIHRCLKCGQEATKHSIMLLCNLVYPEIVSPCKLSSNNNVSKASAERKVSLACEMFETFSYVFIWIPVFCKWNNM